MRLPEVSWNIRQALVVYLGAWIGFPLLIWLTLSQASHFYAPLQSFLVAATQDEILPNLILSVVNTLAALALVAYYLHKHHAKWSDVGLRRFPFWRTAGYIFLGLLLFSLLVAAAFTLVGWLFPSFNPDQAQVNEFTQASTPGAKRLSFIALVLIPPFIEEVVFRGFMLPAFARRIGFLPAAVVTSLLFGIAHLQSNIIVYTLVLGVLLCMMYRKLGSIYPGIIFHMINNLIAFSVLVK